MIIVAGSLYVDESARETYLAGCTDVITAARSTAGCIDFHLSADPVEPDRINVFEQWESAEAVEAFRGSGPSGEQAATIRRADVNQYEVTAATSL